MCVLCECGHPQMFSLPPSDRYQALPSILHRVDFLNVQIHLLLEFHLDLASAVERAYSTPTAPTYLAYLNAAQYISHVLQQWGEEAVRHTSFTPHTVVLMCALHTLGMLWLNKMIFLDNQFVQTFVGMLDCPKRIILLSMLLVVCEGAPL